ncbi:hypothetical protein LZ009_24180, partial [Ramlibacter sp. XY19]|uniref:hypothetical protein n=1 Tax=Ramlibacter paludis TaxID=2908000 RepID=UPI0023DA8FE0
ANGTTLSVVVPALARSGAVTVLGSGTSFNLQVVPTLRGVSGDVAAGNTLLAEGTGLTRNDLVITVGGLTVTDYTVRTIFDGSGTNRDQQLLTLVVPAGTLTGQAVVVSTAGGTAANRHGVVLADNGIQAQASDPPDTLAAAVSLGLLRDAHTAVTADIGGPLDVDLYALTLDAHAALRLTVTPSANYSTVRIFDAGGVEQASRYFGPNDGNPLEFTANASGTYYVGISGYGNIGYNPSVGGSGTSSGYTGTYQLNFEAMRGGSNRLSGMTASAASGTAAQAGLPSANTGQTLTLAGVGLLSSDRVVFTTVDTNGSLGEQSVAPTAVDLVAQTLTVRVPDSATTGMVRLERDRSGMVLQVVPTVTDVTMNPGGGFVGNNLTLRGTGFAEAGTTVSFGATQVDDRTPNYGIDVYSSGVGNSQLNMVVPGTSPATPSGPIRVSTAGGTSAAFNQALTGITSTPASGVAADAGVAAAVPGQVITLTGTGLDTSIDVVFQTVDASGNRGEIVVRPNSVSADASQALVTVPVHAVTGSVRLVGDVNGAAVPLQIVPAITDVDVEWVAGDGSYASVLVAGLGFVEGSASEYHFGSLVVFDGGINTGPDVFGRGDAVYGYVPNGYVRVTVPLGDAAFGAISVSTDGGQSASYSVNLASVTSTALRGTAANAGEASANAGQAIT